MQPSQSGRKDPTEAACRRHRDAHRQSTDGIESGRAESRANLSPAVAGVFPYFLICSPSQSNLDPQARGWGR